MRSAFALLVTLLSGLSAARAQEPTRREILDAFGKQLQATIATAGPSVATIVVSRSEHYPNVAGAANTPGKLGGFDPTEFTKDDASVDRSKLATWLDLSEEKSIPDHGYAGGVVIDASGLVLTPYHVIEGATRVYVFLPGRAGSYADIHAADSRSDLAVLKLIDPPNGLKPIKFGTVRTVEQDGKRRTVEAGKLVVLLANSYSPRFGLQTGGAFGSLTNVRFKFSERDNPTRYTEYGTLLEYDVKPNAGLTGGVLLNLDGEMIGMVNAGAAVWDGEIGPGYAVPADAFFQKAVDVLRRGGEVEYGFLGVQRGPETPTGIGVIPTPRGPAESAGVQFGEEIRKINGVRVRTFNDLLLHIGSSLAGSKVTLTLGSGNRERDVEVTLAKFRHQQPFIASVRPDPVFGLRVDYSSVLAQQLNGDRNTPPVPVGPGVCAREVVPDSPAAAKFKAIGEPPTRWLITQVNGTPVASPAEFYKAAKGQDKVRLTLVDPTEKGTPRERELTLP